MPEIDVQVDGTYIASVRVVDAEVVDDRTAMLAALVHPDVKNFVGERKVGRSVWVTPGKVLNLITTLR